MDAFMEMGGATTVLAGSCQDVQAERLCKELQRVVYRSQIERHLGFPSDSKLMSSSLRTLSSSSIENS
jgi:hypothetical protein